MHATISGLARSQQECATIHGGRLWEMHQHGAGNASGTLSTLAPADIGISSCWRRWDAEEHPYLAGLTLLRDLCCHGIYSVHPYPGLCSCFSVAVWVIARLVKPLKLPCKLFYFYFLLLAVMFFSEVGSQPHVSAPASVTGLDWSF